MDLIDGWISVDALSSDFEPLSNGVSWKLIDVDQNAHS
jgi:hypothetical protein